MKKIICGLVLVVLCLPMLGSYAFAAPKAYETSGFYDNAGLFGKAETENIDKIVKSIYDRYRVSVYINVTSGAGVKMGDYATDFYVQSVAPYIAPSGDVERGVLVAYDDKTHDYYAAPFLNTDDRMMSAYSPQFLNQAVGQSFQSAKSLSQAMSALALALGKRAEEFYGPNATGKVEKTTAPQPGPSAADLAMAKAKVYSIGGENIPSIYGTVGEREIIAAQTGKEGGAEYFMGAYKTDSIEQDAAKFFTALGADGWVVTNQQGTYSAGSASVAKRSKDEGCILAVTMEFQGASYQVNAAKMPGTLNLNK
jgi:hypothetical protein